MESTELITKDKLEFLGIIKESLKIPAKNPTFILLSFLTSLPAFCFFLWQHLVLHQLIYEAGVNFVAVYDPICGTHWPLCSFPPRYSLDSTLGLIQRLAPTLALSAFSYLTIGHFLNVLNTIVLVHSASTIYAEKEAGSLKEMLFIKPFQEVGSLRGPYITSIYNLAMVWLTLAGVVSFVVQMVSFPVNGLLSQMVFGLVASALVVKYLEWSAIWNVGLVVSILEEKHGYIGIGVAGYISRGCRGRGFLLMVVFLVWRVFLRMVFGYYGYLNKESGSMVVLIAVGEGGLVWFGEVVNWVVCTVYYYDCKRRFLEKKVDSEKQGGTNLV
ncbi:unnamed protein product [Linum tenue]|uniref:Transmembrane protein n=2 Tax=Linum tenue TaxID=586396 RepID=A0AAV0N9Y9_9ROSI|nr:unnamed protein product [Linum tenue]